jgi:hypothetical protein
MAAEDRRETRDTRQKTRDSETEVERPLAKEDRLVKPYVDRSAGDPTRGLPRQVEGDFGAEGRASFELVLALALARSVGAGDRQRTGGRQQLQGDFMIGDPNRQGIGIPDSRRP